MDDGDYDPYEDIADDASVGSLGVIDSPKVPVVDQRKSFGAKDDTSNDPNSPDRMVRKKVKGVGCTKSLFIILLIVAGLFLTIASVSTTTADNKGGMHAAVVAGTFAILILVFLRYDFLITRRNSIVMDMAKRSHNIVDQLFPSVVRDRLLNEGSSRRGSKTGSNGSGDDPAVITDVATLTKMNTMANKTANEDAFGNSKKGTSTVKSFLSSGADPKKMTKEQIKAGQPMAELFSNTTVLFADIAGTPVSLK
jgi:hypothetical protein